MRLLVPRRWRRAAQHGGLVRLTAQLPEEIGGGEGRALILDTEGTFRPERVLEIASRFDLNGEDVLDNLQIARIYTPDHLEKALVLVEDLADLRPDRALPRRAR